MRTLWIGIGLALTLAACGAKNEGKPLSDEVRAAACEFGVVWSDVDPEEGRCDIRVNDLEGVPRCFDTETSAHACACAGCASEQCVFLESYPAQVRCEH